MPSERDNADRRHGVVSIVGREDQDKKDAGGGPPVAAIEKGIREFIKLLTESDKVDAVIFIAISNDGWSKGEFWTKDDAKLDVIDATIRDVLQAMQTPEGVVH